jgi:hypothetical protein
MLSTPGSGIRVLLVLRNDYMKDLTVTIHEEQER